MKFVAPAGDNPIDRMEVVGKPIPRIDGPLKVTGRAPYAYERHDVAANPAYGFPLGAGIAKGRIRSIDTEAAKAAPGVIDVLTAPEFGNLGKSRQNHATLFGGYDVQHYHQAVAMVVAESFEAARAASRLITVDYEEAEGRFDLDEARADFEHDGETGVQRVGDFEGAFAEAPVTLDAEYRTPDHSHAMMEPHATIAAWEGDRLTVWTSSQMINWARESLAETLHITKDNVRVDSPFVGGGFGVKLFLRVDAVLAALGAQRIGRPVKVALPRAFIFNNTPHRAATIQRIRIGATPDGKITAIAHENHSGNLPGKDGENATAQTRHLYAGANRLIANSYPALDLPEANAMRAPGEASGMMALEVAMDEMAEKLGMDPVEFRIVNDTQVDPEKPQRPFSDRRFIECLRTGADAFGWSARNPVAGQRRDGAWMVGLGMSAGYRGDLSVASGARIKLQAGGRVVVETDMTDIGTGSYTILAQTAAEMMGVPIGGVEVRLGSSDFPISAGSGGQFGANMSTSGVYAACVKLRAQIAERAGIAPDGATFADGAVIGDGRRVSLAEIAAGGELVAEDRIEFDDARKRMQIATFAAHFVEAAVHAATGEIRIRRMLTAADAGRILNPITARSQMIGGMTMGVGGAIMEELAVDTHRGFFVNHDLAGYEVPVHADIVDQQVVFIGEGDANSSPMKAKGIGELGLCGVSAAIANAIYNATGVRVREYPITLDKLLPGLPAL